jgi:glycosyltransferase involved in cell wall biosynthesis
MRVLWLCNRALCAEDAGATGTWLGAMARGLLDAGVVELGIIASGPVRQFTRRDYRQVKQWVVPSGITLGRDGLPPASLVQTIAAAVNEFCPSLIHSWGTENFWALLPARGLLPYPALLEIQGLKGQIAKVFYGGLTLPERLRCTGIKEVLKRRTMHSDRRDFARWSLREEEMIRGHRFVDVQSPWVASQVRATNLDAHQLPVDLALRQPFYGAVSWQPSGRSTVFCTAAYTSPFKGLHVAVRALALLKSRIPDARLRIAGAHQREGIRQDGYIRWVNRMIRQLGLADAIEWLGPLNAEQIVTELSNAAAVVIPTFIETYCVAFAEAMIIGTPTVVAYSGGTAYLGKDEESCLFFPPGDHAMCTYQLERVLRDRELAVRLSQQARSVAAIRHDRRRIVQRQLEIYRQILGVGKRV